MSTEPGFDEAGSEVRARHSSAVVRSRAAYLGAPRRGASTWSFRHAKMTA